MGVAVRTQGRVGVRTGVVRRGREWGTVESIIRTMVGREREQETLSAFVAASGGRALVLRGDTGVGKSALLDHVAELATGEQHRVIRAAGVEAESELPFAGLHQFLYPLLSYLDRLDEVHRRVFDVVFARSEGTPPSVMTLGIAVLDLLSLAASQKPILLVLDDGQWLDASSTEVCGFVGRRLTGSSVKLIVGLRAAVRSGFDTAALPELPVTTLSEKASEQLLDMRYPGLDPQVRRLVLDEAQGNPLALLELPPHVRGGRAGRDPEQLPGYTGISLPQRLQHVYGARIETLDDAVRAELLRGALDGVGAGTAAGRPGGTRYRMMDADEAAACGLLGIDPPTGTSSSGIPWCGRRSSRWRHPTSGARPTPSSPKYTARTWNGAPCIWRPRRSIPTIRSQPYWKQPRTPPPGAAAPLPPWPG